MEKTDRPAYEQWLICQERGHQASNFVTSSIPPQDVCKWCGTYYWREEPILREHSAPKPPEE